MHVEVGSGDISPTVLRPFAAADGGVEQLRSEDVECRSDGQKPAEE